MLHATCVCGMYTDSGLEQSRRDDMESLGYLLLYLCNGRLLWQGLEAATKKEKYDRIRKKKASTSIEFLCKGLPNEFAVYLNYTRNLRFDEKPDYSYLRQIFRDLFVREGFQYEFVFDWTAYIHRHNQAATRGHGTTDAATCGQTAASALKQAPLQEYKLSTARNMRVLGE